MPGTAGHFRAQCPVKSPGVIPIRFSVKITMGIKSPTAPWPCGGSMLRGKSKCMFLLIPRCLAAFPASMGGPDFYKCIVSMSSNLTERAVEKQGEVRY